MTRCPKCKEPVSQFAAGCAICGADLEQARRARAGKRQLPSFDVPSVPQDAVILVILAIVVLFSPILGVVLCLFAINRENASHQRALRLALWAYVVVGVLLLVLPGTRYAGLLSLLYG